LVGCGRAFWEHFYPVLRDTFPDQFRQIGFETFYRAINKVQRSLIRRDADEVTYNLHIMITAVRLSAEGGVDRVFVGKG